MWTVEWVQAYRCTCNQCGHQWSTLALPSGCPNRKCRSRQWDGKKTKKAPERRSRIKLPKPVKVRSYEEAGE